MTKIATRLQIPPYALVRRQTEKWEENMIAGEAYANGMIPVYSYSGSDTDGRLVYKFVKAFKPEELRVVGLLQSPPDTRPKLIG